MNDDKIFVGKDNGVGQTKAVNSPNLKVALKRLTLILDTEADTEIIQEIEVLARQNRAAVVIGQAAASGASEPDAPLKAEVVPASRRFSMRVRVRMTQKLERVLMSVDCRLRSCVLTALVRAGWPDRYTLRISAWAEAKGSGYSQPDQQRVVEPQSPEAQDDLNDDWIDRTARLDPKAASRESRKKNEEVVRFGNVEFPRARPKGETKQPVKTQGFSVTGLIGDIDDLD